MSVKSILWPTDARPSSLAALSKAIELAEKFQAELVVLHVVNPVPAPSTTTSFVFPEPAAFDVPMYEQQLIDTLKETVQKLVDEHVPEHVKVVTEVRLGEIDEVIVDTAKSMGSDLIVMSTHGRSGVTHFLLGSVTERVIRSSPVPVMAVPGAKEESS